ncbi:1-acyl-sn-glycerol-3-phosphate acyltransferase [Syntrophus gentianae]|uniref:1-acyl-sn-glycerol-3-phosphate acyltransferase n=1 Tax=Syntrophus gentianae TaxID=43775 RepID=A0A1H7ZVZ7_9BACT|nr:lysophospholipid acyltransferase family protein [Syntrophus gentianae]SEM61748.1 1-acyl-sn-glycerol-3-phosphate acyltransferase [Syntrophus gentianae]
MSETEKSALHLQYFLGRIAIFILGPLIYLTIRLAGYRVRDIRKIRHKCHELFKIHEGPWIICANHLTMIDSAILAYVIAPVRRYVFNYKILPWNVPERANFQRNLFLTVLCYLSKCIPISRGGDRREVKSTLEQCLSVLKSEQNVLIFPEGGRSRVGHVDTENFSYGIGQLIESCEECKVLCIYLRGDGQETYSNLPRWGEKFSVRIDVIEPAPTELTGRRAHRHYAAQCIQQLALMEEQHFASRRQRHRGSDTIHCQKEEQEYSLSEPRLHA